MNSADRAMAASLIERWFQGTITNDEFDDVWPWNSLDSAVREIGQEIWSYFDDAPTKILSISELIETGGHFEKELGLFKHRSGVSLRSLSSAENALGKAQSSVCVSKKRTDYRTGKALAVLQPK